MEENKRKEVRKRHAVLEERLEKEVAEGKFGENPSYEDMAAVLSQKKKVNRIDLHNRRVYDNLNFRLRKDGGSRGGLTADAVRRAAKDQNLSFNEYVVSRLVESMEAHGELHSSPGADDGEVTLFMPEYEAEPIVIEGEEADLLRDLANASGKGIYDMIREFVASKQNNGFWRDRE